MHLFWMISGLVWKIGETRKESSAEVRQTWFSRNHFQTARSQVSFWWNFCLLVPSWFFRKFVSGSLSHPWYLPWVETHCNGIGENLNLKSSEKFRRSIHLLWNATWKWFATQFDANNAQRSFEIRIVHQEKRVWKTKPLSALRSRWSSTWSVVFCWFR